MRVLSLSLSVVVVVVVFSVSFSCAQFLFLFHFLCLQDFPLIELDPHAFSFDRLVTSAPLCVCFASDLCILSCVIVCLVTRVNCLLFDS